VKGPANLKTCGTYLSEVGSKREDDGYSRGEMLGIAQWRCKKC